MLLKHKDKNNKRIIYQDNKSAIKIGNFVAIHVWEIHYTFITAFLRQKQGQQGRVYHRILFNRIYASIFTHKATTGKTI